MSQQLFSLPRIGDMKTLLWVTWLTAATADFLGDLLTKHHQVRKALFMNWEPDSASGESVLSYLVYYKAL